MTSEEFIQQGQEIVGVKRDYQRPLAEKIKKKIWTVKRYASGARKVPDTVAELMRLLLDGKNVN